jgi:hypothetical protein
MVEKYIDVYTQVLEKAPKDKVVGHEQKKTLCKAI